MHTVRIIIGGVLALALSGISILCCYIFGTHLAPGQEGQIYGTLGGVADALKSILPIGIAAALASRQRGRAAIGIILFTVFSVYSFASELGLYALSRDAQASSTNAGQEQYRRLKDEQTRIQDRLKALGQTRPSRTIDAELAGQKQNRSWTLSNECQDASSGSSRTFCAGIEKLKAELATAEEAETLRAKDDALAAKLAGVNLADALKSAAPQSEALARLTGFPPASIKDGLAILVAILIELGSGLGLFAATAGHAPEAKQYNRRDDPKTELPPSRIVPADRPAPRAKTGCLGDPVRSFAKAALRPAADKTMAAAELHAAFTRWAELEGHEQLSPAAFGRKLTGLNFQRVKKGGVAFYSGIEIAPGARLN